MGIYTWHRARRVALALILTAPLAACATAPGNSDSFRKTYFSARTALEEGEYRRANKQYQDLLQSAGPFLPRIQLEYAHSLLRAGDYAGASQVAETMSLKQDGAASAAALAVAATARHEMGIAALAQGDTATGKAHLQKAQTYMAQVLDSHPEMDPLGALAGRKTTIEVRLRNL